MDIYSMLYVARGSVYFLAGRSTMKQLRHDKTSLNRLTDLTCHGSKQASAAQMLAGKAAAVTPKAPWALSFDACLAFLRIS